MTREEMFTVANASIEQIVEGMRGREIRDEESMRDYGADSLQIVEVVSRSMRQLKIRVPRTQLAGADSLSDLLDLFERAASGGAGT